MKENGKEEGSLENLETKSTTNQITWDSIPIIDYVDKVGNEPSEEEKAKLDELWEEIFLYIKASAVVDKLEKEIESQNKPKQSWTLLGHSHKISGGFPIGKFSYFAGSPKYPTKSNFGLNCTFEILKKRGTENSIRIDTEGTSRVCNEDSQ